MHTSWAIILGGNMTITPRLHEQLAGRSVIVADGGMRHAEALGVAVSLWVGDFDSAPLDMQARHAHLPRITWPRDKDKTDGVIACEAALDQGAEDLLLVGALGGQTDHATGMMMAALCWAEKGYRVTLSSGNEEAFPLSGGQSVHIQAPPETRLSIVGVNELVGLSVAGVRWPLTGQTLPCGCSRTIANEIHADAGGNATISLDKGRGFVFIYP